MWRRPADSDESMDDRPVRLQPHNVALLHYRVRPAIPDKKLRGFNTCLARALSLSPSLYLSHSQPYTRSQDVPTTYDGQGMLLIWTVMVPDFWLKRWVAVPLVCSRRLHVLEINLSYMRTIQFAAVQ